MSYLWRNHLFVCYSLLSFAYFYFAIRFWTNLKTKDAYSENFSKKSQEKNDFDDHLWCWLYELKFSKTLSSYSFFESIYNNVTKNQTFIRVRRLDNSIKMIYLYHYFVEKTWISFNVVKNIRKCIFETTTLINKKMFKNVENEINEKIDIEDWIWCDEKLFDACDFHVLNHEFSIFTSIELLIKMMKIRIDEFVETK